MTNLLSPARSKPWNFLPILLSLVFLQQKNASAQPAGLPWPVDPTCQSIITNGIAAVTCGTITSVLPAERFTFGLMNIAGVLPAFGRVDVTPSVEMYHHPSWHIDSIGNVFGITMDRSGNTFIAASSNYGAGYFINTGIIRYGDIGGGANSVAAAGTIYKIDGPTGQASVFTVLPQQAFMFQNVNCEGGDIVGRNTGPGLGNLVFSPTTKQFYVTNFEDGRIYRLDQLGNILDSYDPFGYDDGIPGAPSELNETAYGVDVTASGDALFFGNAGSQFFGGTFPSVFSIPLNPDGSFVGTVNNSILPLGATWDNFVGTEQLHFMVTDNFIALGGDMQSVSDLEFTPDGKLLLGARTGCEGSIHSSYNHGGQAIRLSLGGGGLYNVLDGNIFTGYEFSIGGSSECYGGVSVYEAPDGSYQYTFSSADMLEEPGPHGICLLPEGVFGASGFPASPAGAINYGFDLFNDPKGVGGDIKVFVACAIADTCAVANFNVPPPGCDSLTVSPVNLSSNATSYQWFFNDPANPGATSTDENPTYTYTAFGTYEITLVATDDSLCADTITLPVTLVPNTLEADFDLQALQCANNLVVQATDLSADAAATITAWQWTLVTTTNTYNAAVQNPAFSVTETGPATLTLTVTNSNGCTAEHSQSFLIKNTPLSLDLGPDLDICGTPNITLDAGFGFANYLWSTAQTTQSITVTASGTYSVTAIDACGETYFDEVNITIDTVEVNMPAFVELCPGGSFAFNVPGFASYTWSPASGLSCTDCPDPVATPGASTTYLLTATTADDCVAMGSTQTTVLPTFQTNLEFDVCEGETIVYNGTQLAPGSVTNFVFAAANGCDSTVTVSVFGLQIFSESLSLSACPGETVAYNGTSLAPGSVTDFVFAAANGCDSVVTVTVVALPNVATSATVSICFGETTTIFGTTTGTAGTYNMTFTAANGCDSTHTVTLIVFNQIFLQTGGTDPSCFGAANGTATATAAGGSGIFTFEWSNGDSGASIAGLTAGTYTVTATDGNGCAETASVTLGQPSALVASASGVNVGCDELGSASANASGGTPGYSFEWSTTATTTSISGLVAGNYTVTATDANGCTDEASDSITGALGPEVSVLVDQNLTADEPESGELTALVLGGTAPLALDWSNGETTTTIDSLASGEYTVTVTDANACTAEAVAYLFVPACTGGKIWNDRDRDGCQDGAELGLGGIELLLDGTDIWGNAVTATTTSAINGEYIFEGLPPGNYQVFLPVPSGWDLSPANACADDFTDSDFTVNNGLSYTVELPEGHCCLIVDGGLFDDCLQVTDPGSICCDQVLCGPGNDPAPITSTAPATGAGGPIEYLWMRSANGGPIGNGSWTAIGGTNSPGYDPGSLSQTTHFARCVRAIGCANWVEGNVVEIFVDDVAVANISGASSACVGDIKTYTATDNGPGASYLWDFGPWASPSTATSQDVDVTWNQAGVVYISLSVTANGCTSTGTYGVAISDSPVICPSNIGVPGGGGSASFLASPNFTLLPNPVSDHLVLGWDRPLETDVFMEMTALDGRRVWGAMASGSAQYHRADLSGLVSGMYLLRVRYSDGEQVVFRVVKP